VLGRRDGAQVPTTADAAIASLDPIRSRLLAELAVPSSATALGNRLGLPRQKVNYHLRTLEQPGLIELPEERKRATSSNES
jgi:predicted ArsR family transcriptional regulator